MSERRLPAAASPSALRVAGSLRRSRARAARRSWERRSWWAGLVTPGFLFYAVFVLVPIVLALRYSLYEWDGINPGTFVGLDNYARAFEDPLFGESLLNVLKLAVFFSLLPVALALVVTFVVSRSANRAVSVFRTAILLPYVLSTVVVAAAWSWIYSPLIGPLNVVLRDIGLESATRPWLQDFGTALPALGLVGTWAYFGFVSVFLIAGAQKIDESLYESARLDGASAWKQFRFVTLPGIRNELTFVLVITLILAWRVFDLVFVLTKGGPGYETYTVGLLIYNHAFNLNEPGYAAALAVLLTAIIFVTSLLLLAVRERGRAA